MDSVLLRLHKRRTPLAIALNVGTTTLYTFLSHKTVKLIMIRFNGKILDSTFQIDLYNIKFTEIIKQMIQNMKIRTN